MKRCVTAVLSTIALVSFALGDNNPTNIGGALAHNAARGMTLDGAFGNPALVGTDMLPKAGLSLLPTSAALWSDKLALPINTNFIDLLFDSNGSRRVGSTLLSSLFEESFGVSVNDSPDKVSRILTNELRDGLGIYVGARTSPFTFATRGFGFSVTARTDVDVRIPGGLLLPIFSETEGILAGKSYDISGLKVEGIVASELAVKLGFSHTIPAISDYLNLDKGALGVGLKGILGHGYFNAKADKSSEITYDSVINKYKMGAHIDILNIGTGIYGKENGNLDYDIDLVLKDPPPTVSGQGWGLDIGTVFYNKNHFVSIDVQDIGMIFWDGKKVHRGSYAFSGEFDIQDLSTKKFLDIFDLDTNPLAITGTPELTWLPTTFNFGYSYLLDFSNNDDINFLIGYMIYSANYRQQLVLGPGKSTYMPRLAVGTSIGLLAGFIPVRFGIISGGPENGKMEKLSSSAGVGIDLKYTSLDFSYKGVGTPYLIPKNGFEVALAFTVKWGWKHRRAVVKAPPEEKPEPEPTPLPEPEPKPPLPELKVEFAKIEDAPIEEVYPPVVIVLTMLEPPQPTVEETQKLNTSQKAINFKSGGWELDTSSFSALNDIAGLLIQYPHIRYEIQGHTDAQGGDLQNLLLSAERAVSVKNYLLGKGAPEESIIAIGYGKNIPVADNKTAVGRAANRRVEFVQIMSQEQYETLKRFETEMAKSITKRVFGTDKR